MDSLGDFGGDLGAILRGFSGRFSADFPSSERRIYSLNLSRSQKKARFSRRFKFQASLCWLKKISGEKNLILSDFRWGLFLPCGFHHNVGLRPRGVWPCGENPTVSFGHVVVSPHLFSHVGFCLCGEKPTVVFCPYGDFATCVPLDTGNFAHVVKKPRVSSYVGVWL